MTRKPKARSGLIVAIDGPAGAGKSTVSKRLAERLGLVRVDTGAIYRTVALVAKDRRLEDEDAIARACEQIDLRFEGTRVFLGEREVTAAIRTPEISTHASVVSAMPAVRRALLDLQRRFALAQPTGAVLEGRDIGTVVFPDADMKIFLNASIEERARRRTEELEQSGRAEPFERVLAEMKLRDERDQQRAVAPLKAAADAIPIDTTGRSVEEIVEEMAKLVEAARKG